MKKVLITGASGFVGTNLARRLMREGHDVHLLLRSSYKPWRIEEIKKEVVIKLVDLADENRVTAVVKHIKPDWVFHLATYGAYSQQDEVGRMIETNIKGTWYLLRACLKAGVKVMVNTSSSSEYGFNSDAPSEKVTVTPNSDYAVTKTAATLLCNYFANRYQLYIPTLRLYSVYGPYEEPSRLMPTLLIQAQKGKWPPLVNPQTARDFIYVNDICEVFLKVTRRRSKEWAPIYNLGTGKQIRLRQLANIVRKMFQIKAMPRWSTMNQRQWDTSVWRANIAKIRRDYRWKPKYNLALGLQEMNDWLLQPKWQRYYR
jgi:UDP-glucose 4-epimerase